jgi:hypothetical protein
MLRKDCKNTVSGLKLKAEGETPKGGHERFSSEIPAQPLTLIDEAKAFSGIFTYRPLVGSYCIFKGI